MMITNRMNICEIGTRIKLLRKATGMSQRTLANILGKSPRTVQKYESGEVMISALIVTQLAFLFHTPPAYIMGFEPACSPYDNVHHGPAPCCSSREEADPKRISRSGPAPACPHCGSTKYMHNCNGSTNHFCGLCGHPIDWEEIEL